ncbi:uncharacterized protein LOC135243265 [Anguilla rostrata]|uniref:uncharacterized protein LOC135243265 n=1 Tax=Anguilla rostrata TaxID=7938 RepID=UPI0030D49905
MAEAPLCSALLIFGVFTWAHGDTKVRFVKTRPGEGVTLTCSTTLKGQEALTLYKTLLKPEKVFYLNRDPLQLTVEQPFQGRVATAGEFSALSVTISNLTAIDSGLYWCQYNKYNTHTHQLDECRGESPVTVVDITDSPICDSLTTTEPPISVAENKGCPPGDDATVLVLTGLLSASFVFLASVLLLICVIPKVKRFHEKRGQFDRRTHDTVYEEMQPKLRQ